MGKIVRIPKNANVVNAVPYIGVDLKDGRLTVIGAFSFFAFALAGSMGKGMLVLMICYIANRFLLAYKKENMPGFWKRWLYKIGSPVGGSYSKGLSTNKQYLGDNQPIWAGREKFMHDLRLGIAGAKKNSND